MSQIFDALRKSEARRTQSDTPFSLAAIELLERAERAAASQITNERHSELRGDVERERANVIFGPDGLGVSRTDVDPFLLKYALQAQEVKECFSQFHALETDVTEESHLVCCTDSHGPAGEAFRLLALRMRHLRLRRQLKTLLITSTVPGEGKSVVAANLACALAAGEREKVLLLEGDVRRPSMARVFGSPAAAGLCNYLRGERDLVTCIYHLAKPGIWILPSGENLGEDREVIQSPQLADLLHRVNSWFEWVVIDSPPVLPLADTTEWGRLADGILLVARPAITQKRKLQKGLEALDPDKLIGAIMNSSSGTANGDYSYYRHDSEAEKQ